MEDANAQGWERCFFLTIRYRSLLFIGKSNLFTVTVVVIK